MLGIGGRGIIRVIRFYVVDVGVVLLEGISESRGLNGS